MPEEPHNERPDGSSAIDQVRRFAALLPGSPFRMIVDDEGTLELAEAGAGVRAAFGLRGPDGETTVEHLIGRIHDDDREVARDALRIAVATRDVWSVELRVIHPNGAIRWLQFRAIPDVLANGGVGFAGFVTDVTDERLANRGPGRDDATLTRILDAIRDVVILVDGNGAIEYVTPSVRAVLGRDPEDLVSRRLCELFATDDGEPCTATAERLIGGDPVASIDVRGAASDRREVWLEASSHHVPGRRGWVVSCRDRTQQVRDQMALEYELDYRRTLVDLTSYMLTADLDETFYQRMLERALHVVPDAQAGSMLLWDDAVLGYRFVAGVGYEMGALWSIVLKPGQLNRTTEAPKVERLLATGQNPKLDDMTAELFRAAGRMDEIEVTLSVPILVAGELRGFLNFDHFEQDDAFGEQAVEAAEALALTVALALQRLELEASLKNEHDRFEHLALHDSLTDLPNRRLLRDRLAQAMRQAQRRQTAVGLIFLDLDDFKSINDRYGHAAGDELLVSMAERLLHVVRAEDTASRIGGDEFAVVLPALSDPDDVARVVEKIRDALEEPYRLGAGTTVTPKVSLGHAVYPADGMDLDRMLSLADTAMYRDKGERKGEPRDE